MESGLRIRIDTQLREEFIRACKARHTTAAHVLRSFMRAFVEEVSVEAAQGKLFGAETEDQRSVYRKRKD